MKVLIIRPDHDSPEIRDVENDLFPLQEIVGGYIVPVTLASDAVMLADEEGLLKNLPINHRASVLANHRIVGTVIICGQDGAEFTDAPSRYHDLLPR